MIQFTLPNSFSDIVNTAFAIEFYAYNPTTDSIVSPSRSPVGKDSGKWNYLLNKKGGTVIVSFVTYSQNLSFMLRIGVGKVQCRTISVMVDKPIQVTIESDRLAFEVYVASNATPSVEAHTDKGSTTFALDDIYDSIPFHAYPASTLARLGMKKGFVNAAGQVSNLASATTTMHNLVSAGFTSSLNIDPYKANTKINAQVAARENKVNLPDLPHGVSWANEVSGVYFVTDNKKPGGNSMYFLDMIAEHLDDVDNQEELAEFISAQAEVFKGLATLMEAVASVVKTHKKKVEVGIDLSYRSSDVYYYGVDHIKDINIGTFFAMVDSGNLDNKPFNITKEELRRLGSRLSDAKDLDLDI